MKQWLSSELPMRFLSPIVKVFCPSREETHISKFNVRLDSLKESEKAGLLKFTLWPLLQKVSTRMNQVFILRQTFKSGVFRKTLVYFTPKAILD